jgi:lipopolysaccharide transport protein LptA
MKRFGLSLLLGMGVMSAWANQDDALPLRVQSDRLSVDYRAQKGIYLGHVVSDQGSRHLTADHLEVIRNSEKGQFSEIHAYGSVSDLSHIRLIPKPNDPEVVGKADEIIYYPIAQSLVFKGHVELTQAGKIYEGPLLTYDLTTEMVESPAVDVGGRVTMIFPPNPNQK